MNWINNVVRPKLTGIWKKKDVPDDLWVKCPDSGQLIFHKDLEDNLYVVPGSDYHMRMRAKDRLNMIFDEQEYETLKAIKGIVDPLKFKDQKKYSDRLKDARAKSDMDDAVLVAKGKLEGLETIVAVQDFAFMGGSLGSDAGGAIVAGMLKAVELKTPFVLFVASGGARMQEGIFSLMQMPRTTVALQRLRKNGLPYIVVLTDPTMGGVTASYAMLGDIQIAEPGALIGFAGPRVIEQTIREQLPSGFQRSEYLLEKGMVDLVVHRHQMRTTLGHLCALLTKQPVQEEQAAAEPALDADDSDVVEIIRADEGVPDSKTIVNSDKKPAAKAKRKTAPKKTKPRVARSKRVPASKKAD
ncbi:MAG: acetyl-CoA carboxylase, carboxyltransferase subunit beta [Hyphomicrobiaceae bacterium]|nr:acetyl-CoA carboxylase, carboxyltransferase subunit beta [Hyphomicrobiaceae bacterium]